MDPAELMNRLPIPEVQKLKHIGGKLVVDSVRGERLLVRPITPRTELDDIKERTGIVAPNMDTEKKYTPDANMGIVVKIGDAVPEGLYHEGEAVMFSKWSGVEFTENKASGTFKALDIKDIICTMKADEGALGDAIKPVELEAA